jgi:peptide/nickel transport system permease protein
VLRGTAVDRIVTAVCVVGHAIPTFWLGIMLIFTFAVQLPWLPASGFGGVSHLILPAVTLGLYGLPSLARVLRRSLIDVLAQDFIRTARAKGLRERLVITRHAVKNAAIPVVTIFGLQLGALLGGAVITEWVFAYPGIGLLAIQAIYGRDFPVVQTFLIVVSAMIVTINFALDVAYVYLDPRIRHG